MSKIPYHTSKWSTEPDVREVSFFVVPEEIEYAFFSFLFSLF